MTLTAELNQKAKAILIRELGPVDYARFFQHYEQGSGNYTTDRHLWLGEEGARTLHEQASQLAANGELPRPIGAKLLSSDDWNKIPIAGNVTMRAATAHRSDKGME